MVIDKNKPYYEATICYDSGHVEHREDGDLAFLCWSVKEDIKRKSEENTSYAFGFFDVVLWCLGGQTHAVTWYFAYDFDKSRVRFRKGKVV